MTESNMWLLTIFFISLISPSFGLNCRGQSDVVIAIPGSMEQVPQNQFMMLENFLIDMVNYYDISKRYTNVGLVLYGKQPEIITPLIPGMGKRDINTRISLMTQRQLYHNVHGGQNVIKAMNTIIDIHAKSTRPQAPKIGVIFTYGSADLSATNQNDLEALITAAGHRARSAGITMFAVSSGGSVPGFQHLGMDTCRLFSLGDYSDLSVLLPYIASGTCYVFDPMTNLTPTKCFPIVLPKRSQPIMSCPRPTSGLYPDRTNCAYFIQCTNIGRIRTRCAAGTLFDENIKRCNHKEFVSCYSKLRCPHPLGLFKHPFDCGKYLNCFANIPYVQSCPAGLYFNTQRKYCDYKFNVGCTSKPIPRVPQTTFNSEESIEYELHPRRRS